MSDHDIIIVGAGVAGLSAAMAAAAHGCRVLVIDRLGAGGQVVNVEHIENYPGFPDGISGIELGPALQEQAEAMGAEFRLGEVEGITRDGEAWVVSVEGDELVTQALIWAAGSQLRSLGVEGEETFQRRGLSSCASCDGPFFRDKPVMVAGGGDSAVQEALALLPLVGKVTLAHPGPELGAQAMLIARLADTDVEVLAETRVTGLIGDDGLQAVAVERNGQTEHIEAAGIFAFTGLSPNTAPLEGLADLDAEGRVRVDVMMQSSAAGLWAAGDVRAASVNWLAAAAGDGTTAGIAAARWCRGRTA
ncbi:NAD(P)/FAD-dependent oxidoreductase [Phaeobacter italicus]|uniref:NAD(P)/FAD-dependent oxidoreductase n=1 Tax=Phaeobacter italicus TaxID=481446 RepID=UPI00248F3176|nr:FAD-dependent oxidoreductase [Phaeobacter italicus]